MALGVQQEDVSAAADALLRAGEQPTIERVRLHLGRGSPNTVGPLLKNWFRDLGARLDATVETAPDIVAEAAARLWEAALEAARQATARQAAQAEAMARAEQERLEGEREALAEAQLRLAQREADLEAAVLA
ncbi:DNA-binding protein, partial [Bordetella avium]